MHTERKLAPILLAALAVAACSREGPDAPEAPDTPPAPEIYWSCGGYEFAAVPDGDAHMLYLPDGEPFRTDERFRIDRTREGATVVLNERTLDCVPKEWGGPWQAARERGAVFRGIGQEPGWHVEVDADQIRLTLDYGERTVTVPVPEIQLLGGAHGYQVTDPALLLLIEDLPCFDIMSGQVHPETVTVQLDGVRYFGCGVTF
jgi:hypothetical protein